MSNPSGKKSNTGKVLAIGTLVVLLVMFGGGILAGLLHLALIGLAIAGGVLVVAALTVGRKKYNRQIGKTNKKSLY